MGRGSIHYIKILFRIYRGWETFLSHVSRLAISKLSVCLFLSAENTMPIRSGQQNVLQWRKRMTNFIFGQFMMRRISRMCRSHAKNTRAQCQWNAPKKSRKKKQNVWSKKKQKHTTQTAWCCSSHMRHSLETHSLLWAHSLHTCSSRAMPCAHNYMIAINAI